MSPADIIILILVAVAVFFAIRAMVKAKKKGSCVGCSSCSNNGCCGHCEPEKKDKE